MKIGVRAHDYGKMSIGDLVKSIQVDHFETIQLAIPKAIKGINSYDEVDNKLIDEIKQVCYKEQMGIAVLGCYIDAAASDTCKRLEEVRKFERGIEIAKKIGAGCVGTETSHFTKDSGTRKEAFARLIASTEKMLQKAEDEGVDIGIEPVADHTLYSPELTNELIRTMQSSRLKVIFDPVNLLTADNIEKQDELFKRCFECFGEQIITMHFKGTRLNEITGRLEQAAFEDSHVHYARMFEWLNQYKQDISILREEANPTYGKQDYHFIKKFCKNNECIG